MLHGSIGVRPFLGAKDLDVSRAFYTGARIPGGRNFRLDARLQCGAGVVLTTISCRPQVQMGRCVDSTSCVIPLAFRRADPHKTASNHMRFCTRPAL